MSDAEITIIGAGVAGLCVATELASRGASIRLLDRAGQGQGQEQGPGDRCCSWWAGGMLAPYCEGESAEEPVTRWGLTAADWWSRYTGVCRKGSLVVALDRDRVEIDRFARRTTGHDTLGPEAVAALEPDLDGRIRRALFFRDEAHLSPRDALSTLTAHLADQGVPVEDADVRPDDVGGRVVDCRGLAARDVLPDLRGVKGEMLVLHCPDITLSRPVRLLHPRHPFYIVPRGDGVFMLGATQIEASERRRVAARSLLELLSAAYALHPGFAEAEIVEIGVDARPAFPDNMPRIRRRGRVVHVNGLLRHGFLLAPAVARMAADLILNGAQSEFCDEDRR